MKYAFIAAHEGQYSIKRMCQALGVRRSGYYAWRGRPASQREQANQALLTEIQTAFQASHQTYGSPRIHAVLRRKGVVCNRKRVARLMRMHGISAWRQRKRYPVTTQLAEPGLFCDSAQPKMGHRYHLHRHGRRLALSSLRVGFVFSHGGRLGHG